MAAAFFRDRERKVEAEPSEAPTSDVENNIVVTTLTPSNTPSVPLVVKSQFDENIIIDEKNWAVTLVRVGPNHAEIILEGSGECFDANFVCTGAYSYCWPPRVKDWTKLHEGKMDERLWSEYKGEYWALIAHFTGSGNQRFPEFLAESKRGKPEVLIHNVTRKPIKYEGKTQTFSIPSFNARKMLFLIELEKEVPPDFNLTGDSSIFSNVNFLLHRFAPNLLPHNCITWARKMLNFGGINLPRHDSDIWFTSTKQYTDPLSREKEVVTTVAAATGVVGIIAGIGLACRK